MKLGIFIVILGFCYCGSIANPSRCACVRHGISENSPAKIVEDDDSKNLQTEFEPLPVGDRDNNDILVFKNKYETNSMPEMGSGSRVQSRYRKNYQNTDKQTECKPKTEAPKDFKMGEFSYIGPRIKRISLSKPDIVRLLQEYVGGPGGSTSTTYGDYEYEL